MPRGPKPQSAEVKRAKGNPGRRRLVDAPPSLQGLAMAPPPRLALDARKIWTQLAPELGRLNFLRESDRPAFERYCEHLAKWWEMTRALRKEGMTYFSKSDHNPDGLYRVNPKFLIRERLEKRLEVLEDRFGLTPAARQQILHRAAMQTPQLPAGGLFGGDQADASNPDQPPPSAPAGEANPIGLLNRPGGLH
jgi:P27 family predicted phage terminase small subunit